jgi:hypothetical protein
MALTRLLSLTLKIASSLPYLALHSAIGMLLAAFAGGAEVMILVNFINPGTTNEFIGMHWVLAVYFIGPVACLLAVPFHVFSYFRLKEKAHKHGFSVSVFVVLYALVWSLLHFTSSSAGQ